MNKNFLIAFFIGGLITSIIDYLIQNVSKKWGLLFYMYPISLYSLGLTWYFTSVNPIVVEDFARNSILLMLPYLFIIISFWQGIKHYGIVKGMCIMTMASFFMMIVMYYFFTYYMKIK